MLAKRLIKLLPVFLSGAAMVAAFAPLSLWWLAWISLAVLFFCVARSSPAEAFWTAYTWGLGLYLGGVSWVYVSLHVYGGMPLWMGSIAVLLFCSVLAMFVALPCWLSAKCSGPASETSVLSRLLLLASLLLVFEWAKSWVLTGFPWLDIGYTQTPSWLFALAPIGGVYLISFTVLLSVACLSYAVFFSQSWAIRSFVVGAHAVALIGLLGLQDVQWTEPSGDAIQVGIVQPNTAIETKWHAAARDQVIARLARLSSDLANNSAELIIWPETALALYYQQVDESFWQAITPPNTQILTGLVDGPELEETYNAAVLYCGGEPQLYRKRHLVPFGEYLPLRFLFNWVLEYLQLPMSDFSAGGEQALLSCDGGLKIGLSICYEDAFANEHRLANAHAGMLVNISEDAWFGNSLAAHQRLQMAQMRAFELAKPMVRSANSGPSAVIDWRGRVVKTTPQFEAANLNHKIQPREGATPYQRWGNWIVWVALSLALLILLFRRKRR